MVLAQSDSRVYSVVASPPWWTFSFEQYRKGQKEVIAESDYSYATIIHRRRKLRANLIAADVVRGARQT